MNVLHIYTRQSASSFLFVLLIFRGSSVCHPLVRFGVSNRPYIAKACNRHSSTYSHPLAYSYEIVNKFPLPLPEYEIPLLKFLVATGTYTTSSQARRACEFGCVILVAEQGAAIDPGASLMGLDSVVLPGQQLAIRTRSADAYYPPDVTGYIVPPILESSIPDIVYQDDEIAILNKPENLTTMNGRARNDLQSVLPFILSPPKISVRLVLPRPVHRLDRRTSGLVLVAKTDETRRRLSQAFENRHVRKTYTAIVNGVPIANGSNRTDTDEWSTIDYPIDGKQATTLWKLVKTNSYISTLQIRPLTGRYHQIRRHLAYCLGTPVVGDSKYDGGGSSKSLRQYGMFLCSNALEFQHNGNNDMASDVNGTHERPFQVEIPLPVKFETLYQNWL
jgi:RluA family pseudouridine synthase